MNLTISKKSYTATVQFGLVSNAGYQATKHGNEMLCELCKRIVETGNFLDSEKAAMKQELEILKNALEGGINTYFQRR